MRASAILTATAILALTGCASAVDTAPSPAAEPVTLTQACRDALAELEKVEPGDFEAEDAAVIASTQACPTVEEYTLGVKDNPASWWVSEADKVDDQIGTIIRGACNPDPATPMCQDAKSLGLLD